MTKAPTGLGPDGKRLWHAVTGSFDLDEHEAATLRDACRTADLIAKLDAEIARDGVTITSPQGRKAHPAVVEVRQQRLTLARLTSALRLPAGEEGDQQQGARPQRRTGTRGVYGVAS